MASSKKDRTTRKILFYIGLAFVLAGSLFPFFIMFMTSVKSTSEAIAQTPTLLPKIWTIDHYADIFNPELFPYVTYFINSMVVSLIVAVISVAFSIFGAYAMSKLKFFGRTTINSSFYVVYMFSGLLLIVPLFKIISSLGLYNTKTALTIALIVQTLPAAIFMLKSYFDTIPADIEEAAMIDGLNRVQIIFYIIMPLSISGIISVFVYAFMIAWNDFLFASVFLSSSENFTLPIGLNALFSTPDYVWGRMMAASIVTALPVIIMYGISERFIKGGAVEGGVKG
ncbi:carbohydrate ABC transporter permease [Planomicrobium sp. CPCC 101110]|uniref:carbohydrate ABC transporter permease n=1 Tax=Planomicrobium sp. CPCC 101110 TaxID=2599619 RepID=UPI0011B76A5F|nr:carbohydrate ABC transporter permease [Planomicrobium sp. CPCC 101110]